MSNSSFMVVRSKSKVQSQKFKAGNWQSAVGKS
jgi:hypothetical protein